MTSKGRSLSTPAYLFRKYNFEAKKLLSKKDATSFEHQLSELDRVYKEVEGVAATDAAGIYKAAFLSYSTVGGTFLASAKKLKRELSSGKDPEQLTELRQNLVTSYNNCVTVSNSLREANF